MFGWVIVSKQLRFHIYYLFLSFMRLKNREENKEIYDVSKCKKYLHLRQFNNRLFNKYFALLLVWLALFGVDYE
jgi:hypothetical protein